MKVADVNDAEEKLKNRKKWFIVLVAFFAISAVAAIISGQGQNGRALTAEPAVQAHEEVDTTSKSSAAKSVETARKICEIINSSGAAVEPCSYSIWRSVITLRVAAAPDEARDFCLTIKETIHKNDWFMEPGWRMDIRHSFSGDSNIASCRLR